MNYKIVHTTEYTYREPISLCHNIARLIPRTVNGQICHKSVINISPKPEIYNEYEDFFGNTLAYFAIQQEHMKLTVTVTSDIEIGTDVLPHDQYPAMSWEQALELLYNQDIENIDARQFAPATAMTEITPEIKEYALLSFTPGRSVFEASFDLMKRIYKDFQFKAGLTTIATPVKETLKTRKGVCQDFAHLAITCIKSIGLPARYVSGYIETLPKKGKEKLVGADASHAWFSVFIPSFGWVDFDPTNNQIPSHQHITIGWGRDYADIAPLKGIILSSRPHKLDVSVDVKRLN